MEKINNGTTPDVPNIGFAEHPHLPGVTMQRVGNKVRVMFEQRADSVYFAADERLYYCDIFEHDDEWTLTAIEVNSTSQGLQTQFAFESVRDRTQTMKIAAEPTEVVEASNQAQTLSLMRFTHGEDFTAFVALEHVGGREFVRSVKATPDTVPENWNEDFRYEYAVFKDNESVLFNVRPDETDAKPVTVAYFGGRIPQP